MAKCRAWGQWAEPGWKGWTEALFSGCLGDEGLESSRWVGGGQWGSWGSGGITINPTCLQGSQSSGEEPFWGRWGLLGGLLCSPSVPASSSRECSSRAARGCGGRGRPTRPHAPPHCRVLPGQCW